MASVRYVFVLMAVAPLMLCVPVARPPKEKDHSHFVIHVPHHVKTVHHVRKVYVPIYKKVYVKEEPTGWADSHSHKHWSDEEEWAPSDSDWSKPDWTKSHEWTKPDWSAADWEPKMNWSKPKKWSKWGK
ncbi:hypothetical protein PPYR_14814 [Photinus pyralis]|uniref:Uncharacterized protein n=1 Tax=Photinus pyralis TaxID=7054 RepID=A0A5N4A6B0_PHOPY|nr:uncharacterized protein LOC116180098 [Photinus pyralis]KAB0792855.1 hypothetical protein PPYR_14814 [Photinus pyralis]